MSTLDQIWFRKIDFFTAECGAAKPQEVIPYILSKSPSPLNHLTKSYPADGKYLDAIPLFRLHAELLLPSGSIHLSELSIC